MGACTSKQSTNSSQCKCRQHKVTDAHCCLLDCFSHIKNYEKMEHLYWIIPFPDHIKKILFESLKSYNAEFLTNIIVEYLPLNVKMKKSSILPKKSSKTSNMDTIYSDNDIASFHIYIHSKISWIYNKTKGPCDIWCNDFAYSAIRVVMLGMSGVGKSALVIRHVSGNFLEEHYDPTISDSFRKQFIINPDIKYMDALDGCFSADNTSKYDSQIVMFDYLDCEGVDDFESLIGCWIRDGDIMFLCFSVDNYESFQCIEKLRETVYRNRDFDPDYKNYKHYEQDFALILVATKCDLINERKVSTQNALDLAKKWQIPYFETSAKENINVNFMFMQSVYEYWVQSQTCSV